MTERFGEKGLKKMFEITGTCLCVYITSLKENNLILVLEVGQGALYKIVYLLSSSCVCV